MRWALMSRQPLNGARVGMACHSDFAIRPRLCGHPLDGVVSVVPVRKKIIEFALGIAAAAHVLNHKHIPVIRVERRRILTVPGFHIWSSDENRWVTAGCRWHPDVC